MPIHESPCHCHAIRSRGSVEVRLHVPKSPFTLFWSFIYSRSGWPCPPGRQGYQPTLKTLSSSPSSSLPSSSQVIIIINKFDQCPPWPQVFSNSITEFQECTGRQDEHHGSVRSQALDIRCMGERHRAAYNRPGETRPIFGDPHDIVTTIWREGALDVSADVFRD